MKASTVQVKVKRGYAERWHNTLRHNGFTWSRKGFWWAPLDGAQREKTAKKNRRNDALTEGMSKEERREFWRNRAKKSA